MKRIAIIGAGNMGQALAVGILKAELATARELTVADIDAAKLRKTAENLKVNISGDNRKAVKSAGVIILAVKPGMVGKVLEEIDQVCSPQKLLISVAAGVCTSSIEAKLTEKVPVIRAMPNMPAVIGEGMSALCGGKFASERDIQLACEILGAVGEVVVVEEHQMDAVTGVSGSGPAYVLALIEALSGGGVKVGLPRELALKLAVQTALGAAKMCAQTGELPAVLRDKITSPGGTTIAALHQLEAKGFTDALISAVEAATKRSEELGREQPE